MRILVIADNETTAKCLRTSLREEGFVVDIAIDCERGSFLALTNDYKLIIFDHALPRKQSKCLCQEIREKKSVPIIILSEKAEVLTKVALFDAGVDDFLAKPFSFEELMARIRAILRRPQKIKNQELRVGNVILNSKKHEARCKGQLLQLTKKEFALLEYLMRHKNEVVSRTSILEHVWDIDSNPFSNTLEAHIRSIRRKLELKCDNNFIKTIPGIGYKIEK